MTREEGFYRGSRLWRLAVRICGRLILDDGRTLNNKARNIACTMGWDNSERQHKVNGKSKGTRAAQAVGHAVWKLRQLDLVKRDGDALVALDLADVAAWVADELAEEADWRDENAGQEPAVVPAGQHETEEH